jgi:hypothetical protein
LIGVLYSWRTQTKDEAHSNERQETVQSEPPEQSAIAEQYQLAGAGGIDPPNGGIKIRLISQQFLGASKKK